MDQWGNLMAEKQDEHTRFTAVRRSRLSKSPATLFEPAVTDAILGAL